MGTGEIFLVVAGVLLIGLGAFQLIDPYRFTAEKGQPLKWWMSTWQNDSPIFYRITGAILVLLGFVMLASFAIK